ncbi:uncharacterized protein LOC134911792 [Pseudophryne corroboree]|uniref:uncharacterized protein LOC134911792 n=1 Tax=Pseudophryne corroboree TaxID=495146 RepID=UPI0030812A31
MELKRDRDLKRKRVRSVWSKEWLMKTGTLSHMSLLTEIRDNPEDYRNYCSFEWMTIPSRSCWALTPYIERQDTKMRRAIPAEERLTATLRFLATGRSLEDLKFGTLISPQALGRIIPDTCKAIVKVLQDQYLKLPASTSEWQAMTEEFATTWQFPNCGGAIDGKHVRINPPANSGSLYYNYKGYFSIVLMEVVNANYELIFIDVGKNGRASDGGSLKNTTFYERLTTKTLNLPSREQTKHSLNFVLVADEAFALHKNIMKP